MSFDAEFDVRCGAFFYYRRLSRVRDYVLKMYGQRLALADVSRVADMERTAFSSFFHRKTGVRFREWLALVRVAKAMELMAERNLSIHEISREVGYTNVRTFQRVFLRVAGQCPIDYKNSVRPC